MSPPEPAEISRRVWASMQRIVAGQDTAQVLRDTLDIGPGKLAYLAALTDGPQTLRAIAAVIGVDASSCTVATDILETRGLVRRGPHPDDNRRKLVSITAEGRALYRLGREIVETPPDVLHKLRARDLAALERILSEWERREPARPSAE